MEKKEFLLYEIRDERGRSLRRLEDEWNEKRRKMQKE